jgi:hypothetical protein
MKRPYPLRVDRLEDRCVPAADATDVVTTTFVLADVTTVDTSAVTTIVTTTEETYPVIDVYLNDPSTTPTTEPKPIDYDQTVPVPESYWTDPTEPIEPVDEPYWP